MDIIDIYTVNYSASLRLSVGDILKSVLSCARRNQRVSSGFFWTRCQHKMSVLHKGNILTIMQPKEPIIIPSVCN